MCHEGREGCVMRGGEGCYEGRGGCVMRGGEGQGMRAGEGVL